mmetsp:Transcript_31790/g.51650  ORF Transcript_31790/g.51650 Transcript_31790/m.51650 type:complete len:411 (-) Transcript_31790:335-1567(-)
MALHYQLSFALLAVLVAFVPFWVSPLKDCVQIPELASRKLDSLETNTLLSEAEHLFKDDLIGPESLAVDLSGSLITGLADGRIVKIYEEEVGKRLRYTVLARTGIDDPKCGSSIEFEEECGRPLGLELINNAKTLIVLDTKGVLSLDMVTNELTTLATHSDDGVVITLPNAVVESHDGKLLYFTDTSLVHQRRRIFWAAMSGARNGRLLAYHFANQTVSVVADGLFMPNGLVREYDSPCVLIALTMIGEIKRYCPEGDKAGLSTFASNIPGTLDNIRQYEDPSIGIQAYTVGIGTKMAKPFSLPWFLAPYPSFRRWICGLPMPYEWLYKLVPKYGMILFLDKDGKVVQTLQDPTGRTSWISEAVVSNGSLWAGSWLNRHIVRLPWSSSSAATEGSAWGETSAALRSLIKS